MLETYLSLTAPWRPPPSPDELAALAAIWDGSIPEEVRSLYEQVDGSPMLPESNGEIVFARLMPVAEVLEINRLAAEVPAIGTPIWLFSDDQGNYAGVFRDAPLRGFAAVLSQEDLDTSPRWRDVASFLSAAMTPDDDGDYPALCDTECDLPVAQGEECPPAETKISVRLLTKARRETDEDMRRVLMFAGARLLSPVLAMELIDFLDDEDPWIPERAVETLAHWDVEAAVPDLLRIALGGRPNGDIAAVIALHEMRNRAASGALRELRKRPDERLRSLLEQFED